MTRLQKLALWLGITPLAIGVGVFAAWYFLRWPALELAGLYVIFGGLAFFATGFGLLIWQFIKDRANAPPDRSHSLQRSFAIATVLLLNFPVAAACVAWAVEIRTRYTLTVYNESKGAIGSFKVYAPGLDSEFGPIPSKGSLTRFLEFKHDGRLEFTAVWEGRQFSAEIESYVTPGMEGRADVLLRDDGVFEVTRASRR